jgi:hypothetical protein
MSDKPKKRPGGQPGNTNGLTSGSKMQRLTVGELPNTMIAVKREGRKYRRDLERLVLAAKDEIGVTDAHLIDTASAATIQAGVCRWLLRNKIDSMSVSDIRGTQADIVKAKERRDAAVKALGLDKPPQNPWIVG